jgi:hypothetical protein
MQKAEEQTYPMTVNSISLSPSYPSRGSFVVLNLHCPRDSFSFSIWSCSSRSSLSPPSSPSTSKATSFGGVGGCSTSTVTNSYVSSSPSVLPSRGMCVEGIDTLNVLCIKRPICEGEDTACVPPVYHISICLWYNKSETYEASSQSADSTIPRQILQGRP